MAELSPTGPRKLITMSQQCFLRLPSSYLLDLSQVVCVAPTTGDRMFRRFTVHFRSGLAVELYENRSDMPACHIAREDFIRALEQLQELEKGND